MAADAIGADRAPNRIDAIDLARGGALLAMAIFHFAWDLEFFGYAEPGMTQQFGWKLFARSIAASFLALVGVSLFLAHRRGIAWPSFGRRFAQIAAAAGLITLATWYATPDRFIFFGILHHIALASLLGLVFLPLPALPLLGLAAACIIAPYFLRAPFFDQPLLWWIGLSPLDPLSNDYVPFFPWFGAVLAGIAMARLASDAGLLAWLAGFHAGRAAGPIRFAGRHGLAFYLLHQPILIGALWLLTLAAPPLETGEAAFRQACERSCTEVRGEDYCEAYCDCIVQRLADSGKLDDVLAGSSNAALDGEINSIASICQPNTEGGAQP